MTPDASWSTDPDGFPDITAHTRAIIEAALFSAQEPLRIEQLQALFHAKDQDGQGPDRRHIERCLDDLASACAGRGVELVRVGAGYRYQTRQALAPWLNRLRDDKPRRLSRALLETLALIAYRQPITRGEIEEVRGVSVASNLIRTLLEYEWVKVIGHRDVPGRPALFTTTEQFLVTFGLADLSELPSLRDIRSMPELEPELDLESGVEAASAQTLTTPGDVMARLDADTLDLGDEWSSADAVNDQVENAWQQAVEPESADTEPARPDVAIRSDNNDPGSGDNLTQAEQLAFIEERLKQQAEWLGDDTESIDPPGSAHPNSEREDEDDG